VKNPNICLEDLRRNATNLSQYSGLLVQYLRKRWHKWQLQFVGAFHGNFPQVMKKLDFCFAYVDDILVFSRTLEEHDQHLRTLFDRLQKSGILINPAKCVFKASEFIVLGYKVSAEGSQPLEVRVAHLQASPPPKTASQLRRFLGMLNFYRRILPNAATAQAPLHDALAGPRIKGSRPIAWTPDLHRALEECKESLSRATLLEHPDPSARLALVTDASTTAMGAVLQQRVDNAWQPLAFFSKKLNPAQQKYGAYDRELLVVYEAVKHFRHMLGARHFSIFADLLLWVITLRLTERAARTRGLHCWRCTC
jgi:hypothetical protein